MTAQATAGPARTLPGSQFPLGATVTAAGTNFAAASAVADGMVLCLFDEAGADPEILALRGRQSRAMLATLLLSFGVPLLLGGDEMGRTQHGNNNAYCQDNELTWVDWDHVDRGLLEFTKRVIALRAAHPVFRRRRFLAGADTAQLRWFTLAGSEMTTADWADPNALAIALYLDGSDAPDRAADGTPLVDDDFLVLVNAWWQPLDFVLPPTRPQAAWQPRWTATSWPGRLPRPGRAAPVTGSPCAPGPSVCCAATSRRHEQPGGYRGGLVTGRTVPRRSWPPPRTDPRHHAAARPRTTGSTSGAGPSRRWRACSRCSRPAWSHPE